MAYATMILSLTSLGHCLCPRSHLEILITLTSTQTATPGNITGLYMPEIRVAHPNPPLPIESHMISLLELRPVNRLLCIGAHPDDIELGAGGTIMRLVEQNPDLNIRWVVLTGADTERAEEARKSAALFTAGAEKTNIEIHGFRDAYLPWEGDKVKRVFEALKNDFSPDLILTHHNDDRHQDHGLVSELTWNTWRDHGILEYEILKWDGDLGRPNVFVPLTESLGQRKVEQIVDTYATQQSRSWFNRENFLAMMRLRGVESNVEFAEAFYARKLVW